MYNEDNFVRVRIYKPCKACNGVGKYECQISYYDRGLETCSHCSGYGHVLKEEKVTTRVDQPFPLAKD